MRALSRGLAAAPDAQLARVVAVVDQLPVRGDADQLIAPLRARLTRLRPPRPLRFARLLFLPLEPLIVAAPRWRPEHPSIPRSVLNAFAATVHAQLGSEAVAIDALIRGAVLHDAAVVVRAGALLWPRAATLLSDAPAPVGWAETGLAAALYPPLARRIGAVLMHAVALEQSAAEAAAGVAPPRPGPIHDMLAGVLARCPEACPMLLAVLLRRVPQCAALLTGIVPELGQRAETVLRHAAVTAVDALLSRLEPSGAANVLSSGDLAETVWEVRHTTALLRQLAGLGDLPQIHPRLQAARQRLDAGCRRCFTQAITTGFLPALREGSGATDLETTARRLRELESDARLLGGGAGYDAQLRQAAEAVAADASRSVVARARLVEILAGAEAAMALLERGGPASG